MAGGNTCCEHKAFNAFAFAAELVAEIFAYAAFAIFALVTLDADIAIGGGDNSS